MFINGIDAAERIRAVDADVPIILYADQCYEAELREVGAVACVLKSEDLAILTEKVDEVVGGSRKP